MIYSKDLSLDIFHAGAEELYQCVTVQTTSGMHEDITKKLTILISVEHEPVDSDSVEHEPVDSNQC